MTDHPEPTSPPRTLTVRGRGVSSADPDLTVLSFGVIGRDPSYTASVEELNGRVEALREDLEAAPGSSAPVSRPRALTSAPTTATIGIAANTCSWDTRRRIGCGWSSFSTRRS